MRAHFHGKVLIRPGFLRIGARRKRPVRHAAGRALAMAVEQAPALPDLPAIRPPVAFVVQICPNSTVPLTDLGRDWVRGRQRVGNNNDKGQSNGLLTGWQSIADHFGRNQSTVRRWAELRGLPVHRAAGEKGVSVFAYTHELDAWLTQSRNTGAAATDIGPEAGGTDPPSPGPAPAAARLQLRALPAMRWAALALVVLVLAGLAAIFFSGGDGRQGHTDARTADALPENVYSLYREAGYLWPKRTRATLLEAEDLLTQVTELAPRFADAHADLATVYNLMVEYHTKPAEEGYGLSFAAAQRAIEIDPRHASALTVLGDISYFWQKNYDEAFGYFRRAVEADPRNTQARQWYASALMTSGRLHEAEVQIREARNLSPDARSIIVSQAMIQMARGDVEGARAVLLQLLENEANYRNPYRFLLFAEVARGDMQTYLETMEDWFEMIGHSPGAIVAEAARAGWHAGGEAAMIEAMAAAARRDDVRDNLERYFRAHVLALAGDLEGALDQLERTPTRQAFYYSIDPAFDEARRDPDFLRRIAELGFPVVPARQI